jgi:hypothetical protein
MRALSYFTYLLMVLLLVTGCKEKEVVPSIQILNNSDVEEGAATQPINWFESKVAPYQLEWTSEESFSPTRSLKISTTQSEPVNFSFWGQTINTNLPFGKDLVLSVRIKTKNLVGQGVSIALKADNTLANPTAEGSTFVTSQQSMMINGTQDWTEYSIAMPSLRRDAKVVFIFLVYLPNTTGEAYFDEITLKHN